MRSANGTSANTPDVGGALFPALFTGADGGVVWTGSGLGGSSLAGSDLAGSGFTAFGLVASGLAGAALAASALAAFGRGGGSGVGGFAAAAGLVAWRLPWTAGLSVSNGYSGIGCACAVAAPSSSTVVAKTGPQRIS